MYLFDRIKSQQVFMDSLDFPVLMGRYLNDDGHYLVPCRETIGKINGFDIAFTKNNFMNSKDSLLSNSIVAISEEFNSIENFEDAKTIHAMLRNFNERLEINDRERFIEEKLFHIEEICRQPAYHLSRDVTKVNIARAKRIPVKSINHLASHSEDWSKRRIRGVVPKMILAETIEYDLQIYENKVASKLIDKLLEYCSNRIKNDVDVAGKLIQKVISILKDMEEPDDISNVSYRKRQRDYERLGQIVENVEKSNSQLEKLQKFISKIQSRLFALLGSRLYIENKNNILSSDAIEKTNLLDNHQHYRYVKILWHKSFDIKKMDCSEIVEENRSIITSFVTFSFLQIMRSFGNLGFVEKRRMGNYSYELKHLIYSFPVQVTKDNQDIISINIANKNILFIPVLDNGDNIKALSDEHRFYLVPETTINKSHILMLSPDDVNSEERITKVIFEQILTKFVSGYLYPLDSQIISQYMIIKNWFLKNTDIIVNKGSKKVDLYLYNYIDKIRMKDFYEAVKEQKANLPNYKQREHQLQEISTIETSLVESRKHFEKYYTCLGCGNMNVRSLKPLQEGFMYTCTNPGCEVSYGVNANGSVFYKIKNYQNIKGDIEDKVGYENIG